MITALQADLDALLAVWRETRAPDVADTIDRVSEILVVAETPIRAVGSTSAKTAWYAALAEKRSAALPRLLETVADGVDRVSRLRALLELPPDPRMAATIRTWLTTPAVLGKNRAGFYAAVLDLAEHVDDVRLAPTLTELAAERSVAVRRCGISNYRRLVAVTESMARVPPMRLDARARALVERVNACLAKPTPKHSADPAELFARIYADPTDDAARAVLADLLSERGDPRGEFINLQLARHGTNKRASAQERKLEQTWGRTWLGPLDPVVLKSGVEFERGFVARVRYIGGYEGIAAALAKEWSTVAALDASNASKLITGSGDLLVSPMVRSLREVTGITPDDLEVVIAKLGRVPWPTLGFHIHFWNRLVPVIAAHRRANPFEAVRTLRVANAGTGVWRVDVPTITELIAAFPAATAVELELEADFDTLVAHDATKHLRRITLFGRRSRVTYDRNTNTFLR